MKKINSLLVITLLLTGCSKPVKDDPETIKRPVEEPVVEEETIPEVHSMSLLAVGDNLIHGAIYYYNNYNGTYYFNDIYENTNYMTQNADFSFINFETICGGTELGLSSYPMFNGPYEVIDGVASAGFDWLSGSSNHTMDRGEQGILNELNYIHSHYPEITITGIHDSWDDYNALKVVEVNGIKLGLLDYTYGLNGLELPEGKEYLVDLIDQNKIINDIYRLNEVSDIQLVSMHWGTEYSMGVNEQQKQLAQAMVNAGADIIIGAHPHVIEPMEYLYGSDGHQAIVYYSLGNFLSAQDEVERMLGGMASMQLSYYPQTKTLVFDEAKFIPTVNHMEGHFSFFRTYLLKDYTNELAAKHTLEGVSVERFKQLVDSVSNPEIPVEY